MAANVCATTTRAIAYKAIMDCEVRRITSAEYSMKDYHEFDKDMLAAARSVPSTLCGGKHGHAFLIRDKKAYEALTGDSTLDPKKMDHPGTVADISNNDSHAAIALKTAQMTAKVGTYWTQEGAADGLRDKAIKSVPKSAIEELEDPTNGFANVTILDILKHLHDKADVVDVLDTNAKLAERDEPIDFEGDTSLNVFFKSRDKIIKELKEDHSITTSHTELMIKYLLQIAKCESDIMRVAYDEWNALAANAKTWKKFKEMFGTADKKRRLTLQARADGGAGVKHHANNAGNLGGSQPITQDDFGNMFAAAFTTFAQGAEESINAAIDNKMKAIQSDKAATDSSGKEANLRKQIDTLQRKLAAMAKKDTDKGTDKGTAGSGDRPLIDCKHCKKQHYTAEDDCWHNEAKPENKKKAPIYIQKRMGWA